MAPLGILMFGCLTIPKYRQQVEDAYQTWIQDAIKKGCIVCIATATIPKDLDSGLRALCVDVKEGDDYNSAMMKQWRGLEYMLQECQPCKMYFCCGSDTFLVPSNALSVLQEYDETKLLYIGSGTPTAETIGDSSYPYFGGGAGFFLSHPLLEEILSLVPRFLSEWMPLQHIFVEGRFFEHEGDTRIYQKGLFGACDLHVGILLTKIENVEWISIDESRMLGCSTHRESKNPLSLLTCHRMKHEDVHDFWFLLNSET